jgi:1-acyl-sn-glycerol-3-phosphate acyltransferase
MRLYPPAFNATARLALRLSLSTLFRFRHGFLEALPPGPKVYAVNHPTDIDLFPILAFAPEPVHTILEGEIWQVPLAGRVLALTNQIKLERGRSAQALADASRLILAGRSILIAPEGQRAAGGIRPRPKRGVIRLAVECRVPIVPVGVYLAPEDVFTRSFVIEKENPARTMIRPRFGGRYSCLFGRPLLLEDLFGREPDRELYQARADALMEEIYALSDRARTAFG